MSDNVRADLATALRAHFFWWANHSSIGSESHCRCGERPRDWSHWADHAADVLLSVPGIAIIELPAYNEEYECFSGGGYPCNGDPEHVCGAKGGMVRAGLPQYMPPSIARSVAAALLAAADAAEQAVSV